MAQLKSSTIYGDLIVTGSTTIGSLVGAPSIAVNSTSGEVTFSQVAAGLFKIQALAAPTTDMVQITNAGYGTTTAGVNGLSITYVGGSAAVEASAIRADITPGGTSGGTWNTIKVVSTAAAASGVTMNVLKVDNKTTGAGTSNIIYAGTGYDNILNYDGTTVINGTGNVIAGQLSGTIPSAVLGNSSVYIGTTGVALNRASATLSIAGIKLGSLTSNGFVKTSSSDGTLSVDTNTYLTANQTITLTGDVSGSGSTSISVTVADDSHSHTTSTLPATMAPSNHNLIDTTKHPVSGLTTGHFLKATGATTYGFAAHGLTYSDVSAPSTTGTNASGTWGISVTGNAATATTLQTARNINGVSFNGSADITITAAPNSHTHGNITNAGAIGTTADLVVTTTTSGVLTTASRSGIDSRSTFPPSSHAITSHTAGTWKLFYSNASSVVELALGAAGTYVRGAGTAAAPTFSFLSASDFPAGYGDTTNPYASKTANYFLAAPNGSAGVPSFRAIVAADIPTLNQNTTGSAATLTTTRKIFGVDFNGSANISHTATAGFAKFDGNGNFTTVDTNTYSVSTHTHSYAGSASAGGAANSVANSLIVKFDTGTTEGTDLYTFNGSAAKTVDIKAGSNISLTKAAGSITIANTYSYSLPTATSSVLGGVKPDGTTITNSSGVISVAYGTTSTTACRGDDGRLSNARTPTAHVLNSASHTVSGLTSGHFLKATGASSFGFAAHGLTYSDVGAAASSHTHSYAGSASAGGAANSVANALTMNNGGSGAASGSTFNGSAAVTISYNTIGASPTAGSTSLTTTGTITTGTWNAGAVTTSLEDAGTNTVLFPLKITRTSSGTPAAGIGAGLQFITETAAGNNEIGATIEAITTDVASTSEDFDLVFRTMAGGAAATESVRFTSDNKIKIGGYSTIANNGTSAVAIVLPSTAGTLVGSGDSGTVTNTMLAGSIANAKLSNSTISGVALGSNLNALTMNNGGSGAASGSTYNGSSAVTISYNTIGAVPTGRTLTLTQGTGVTVSNSGTAYNLTDNRSWTVSIGQDVATTSAVTFSTVTASTFYSSSRRELKKNITPYTASAVELLNSVDVVSFNFKTDEESKDLRVGFIADDTNELLAGIEHDKMDLANVAGLLIKAVQELKAENDVLKQKLIAAGIVL